MITIAEDLISSREGAKAASGRKAAAKGTGQVKKGLPKTKEPAAMKLPSAVPGKPFGAKSGELETAPTLGAKTPGTSSAERHVHSRKTASPEKPVAAGMTKGGTVLKLLRRKKGASIEEMQEVTGWQAHSVRGFLSAGIKKRMGLDLKSESGGDGIRRYLIGAG